MSMKIACVAGFLVLLSSVLCYAAHLPANTVTKVHVVQSNHVDIGFDGIDPTVGFGINVINRYFSEYFPRAIRVGRELIERKGPAQLKWMTQPWLVQLYINCDQWKPFVPLPWPVPAGNTTWQSLQCPTSAERQSFLEAVRNETIVWHAFPFNGEAELSDVSMFEAGVQMTRQLDSTLRKGLAPTRSMSQRDVPGTTRSIIPILKKMNVNLLSVGVNGGSAPPAVPRAFVWKDEISGESLLALYHPGGYGGQKRTDAAFANNQALIPAWRGDNAGPPETAEEVETLWESLATEFPEVPRLSIVASTFDQFYDDALHPAEQAGQLPVVTDEIGDTWVYGAASDPWKLAAMRALMRARSSCIQDANGCGKGWENGTCTVCAQFDWIAIKNVEHTWGLDVKTFLADWTNWGNIEFEKARKHGANYALMQASWNEQRGYILKGLELLQANKHPLAIPLKAALDELSRTAVPSHVGYVEVAPQFWGTAWTCRVADTLYTLALNSSTGSIIALDGNGFHYASASKPQAEFLYTTFDSQDYQTFLDDYVNCEYTGFERVICYWIHDLDFAKPFVEAADPVHQSWFPRISSFWRQTNGCAWEVSLTLPIQAVTSYGAPETVWISGSLGSKPGSNHELTLELTWFNKTTTRLPEALWLHFSSIPTQSSKPLSSAISMDWSLSKLGEQIDPRYVVLNGSNHIHGIESAMYPANSPRLIVTPQDAGIVALGSPNPFPTPFQTPAMDGGLYSNLYNNIWGTNYIMWYPWTVADKNSKFKYSVELK